MPNSSNQQLNKNSINNLVPVLVFSAGARQSRSVYTIIVVFVGWGLFAMEDLTVCGQYLKTCFGGGNLWSAADGYILRSYALTFLILIVWIIKQRC